MATGWWAYKATVGKGLKDKIHCLYLLSWKIISKLISDFVLLILNTDMVGAIEMIVTEDMMTVQSLQQNTVHGDTMSISTDKTCYLSCLVIHFTVYVYCC